MSAELRLRLLCHGVTRVQRLGCFPTFAEPLEPGALGTGRALALRPGERLLCAPELRARQSLEAVVPPGSSFALSEALSDCDSGRWAGVGLSALQRTEPAGLLAWLSDPAAAPHGGESLAALHLRVGSWLASLDGGGALLAVTHSLVIKSAMLHALGAGAEAIQRLDVAPLALVELRRRREWRLRLGCAL